MDAVSSGGERDIGAGVDEENSSQFPVLSSQLPEHIDRLPRQHFQFARDKIFFP